MATVLAVLKIAGLILLGVLLFLLAVLLLVLFVPVRFSIDAEIPDTPIDKAFVERVKTESAGKAGFHWLLHAVRGFFQYPGEDSFCVKVLFFQLIPGKEKKGSETSDEDLFGEEESVEADEKRVEATKEKESTEKDGEEGKRGKEEKAENRTAPEERATAKKTQLITAKKREKPEPAREDERESLPVLLPRFFAKVFEILYTVLTKPYEVLLKMQYTISSACDKIDDVRGFLDSSLFDRARRVVLKQTMRLLRGIKPKHCDVRVLAGTGDPALTADLLAAFSALYPVFGGTVRLEPDFDERIAGLSAHLKGRITIFRVLTCAAIVYFNKDVRRAYKKAKRILRK